MEQEIRNRDPEPAGGGVPNVEVESVMKMLMAYQVARAEGVGQPNPELDHLLGIMQNKLPRAGPKDCSVDEGLKIPSPATQPGPAPKSDEIIPKPFFVLKTKNEKQQKVFINFCGSHKIGAPDYGEETLETVDQVRAKLENFDPCKDPDSPDMRFPCSCLDPNFHKDKKGNTYVIYDVCFNRTVVESAMMVKSLKLFLIDMALSWIGQKYTTELNNDFKLLGRKYKGKEVGKHIIRVGPKKGPIITELPGGDDDEEPIVPLLLRDKQGRSCWGDEVQENCKSNEVRNCADEYREVPEWTPDFRPPDAGNDKMAEVVTPKDQLSKSADGAEFNTSQTSASCEPIENPASQQKKSPQQGSQLPSQSSIAEPWLPTGMSRELNTPATDPDLNTSSSVPDLNAQSPVPDLQPHSIINLKAHASSEQVVETTPKLASASKLKFEKLKKERETSEECEKPKQDDVLQDSLVEGYRAPKVQIEYVSRPVVNIVIIVIFPLDFIGLQDMHVYMTSTGIFIDTKAYGALQVDLQFYVSPAGVLAEYSKCDKILRFELPIVSYAQALKLKLKPI